MVMDERKMKFCSLSTMIKRTSLLIKLFLKKGDKNDILFLEENKAVNIILPQFSKRQEWMLLLFLLFKVKPRLHKHFENVVNKLLVGL